jgi:hypothetical protein
MPTIKPSSLSQKTNKQWAKILMVQILKCDSLKTGDEYLDYNKKVRRWI